MMIDSHERLNAILRRIESEHQDVKRAYFRKFGRAGVGSQNNGKTLEWLRCERRAGNVRPLSDALKELKTVFRNLSDHREKYQILRELYAINPSFHENWFYADHLRSDFKSLATNRHGLKAYSTSARNHTLNRCQQGICTTVVRYTILLENLVSPLLSEGLMDDAIVPSSVTAADIDSLAAAIEESEPTPHAVVGIMPRVFSLVRGLLEATHYRQIESPALLDKWIPYAPCGINEGPIFVRRTDTDLVAILKSAHALEEEAIRHHLSEHFTVEELSDQ